jgi:hypothetical protein
MLKCLIAFVLGYLVARMIRGNGLSVGAFDGCDNCSDFDRMKELCDDFMSTPPILAAVLTTSPPPPPPPPPPQSCPTGSTPNNDNSGYCSDLVGKCVGSGGDVVNTAAKIGVARDACQTSCDNNDSCVGYGHAVYTGSGRSPIGICYMYGSATTIVDADGEPTYVCVAKVRPTP